MNRDQKKQIATICTAVGTVSISALLTAIFNKNIEYIYLVVLLSLATPLYIIAIMILNGDSNESIK